MSKKNTHVHYMYRDANNYKTHEDVIFPGVLTEKQIQELMDTYSDCNEKFVPSQIGLKDLQEILQSYDSMDYGDDHSFHELTEIELTDDPPTEKMSAKNFYELMVNTKWEAREVGHVLDKKLGHKKG